jgi:hypothetical protein
MAFGPVIAFISLALRDIGRISALPGLEMAFGFSKE